MSKFPKRLFIVVALGIIPLILKGCSQTAIRSDGAKALAIQLSGSLQNPAWSPGGERILFTRFVSGYNRGPADLVIFDLRSNKSRSILANGADNVNLPGASWSRQVGKIVFSSDLAGNDQVFEISDAGPQKFINQLTSKPTRNSIEPSMSPDGRRIVFEAGRQGGRPGSIVIRDIARSSPEMTITRENEDCRQPNWSPTGKQILYQCKDKRGWKLWIYEVASGHTRILTDWDGEMTDGSFSPNGRQVVFSGEPETLAKASIFTVPITGGSPKRLTTSDTYDGAPSWSPDGKWIAFESSPYPGRPTSLMAIGVR